MSKKKQLTENINTALRSGDTARPIIGRDAYAPKNGNGTAAKKTLTALVKEAQEASAKSKYWADEASQAAGQSDGMAGVSIHSARTAKWSAAIAAASAIISIITAAI